MRDGAEAPEVRGRLWDGPTRIVHWALVGSIGFAWWAGETRHMDWRRLAGYTVLGLLVFRLLWGFLGSGAARFASFVKGPAQTLAYLRTLPSRAHAAHPGHNPLGALSVLAILAALLRRLQARRPGRTDGHWPRQVQESPGDRVRPRLARRHGGRRGGLRRLVDGHGAAPLALRKGAGSPRNSAPAEAEASQ